MRSCLKNEKGQDTAQLVEHLFTNHETQCSIPGSTNKKQTQSKANHALEWNFPQRDKVFRIQSPGLLFPEVTLLEIVYFLRILWFLLFTLTSGNFSFLDVASPERRNDV